MKNDLPLTDWWLMESRLTAGLLELEKWPRWLRRAFIITLPLSLPVYMILVSVAASAILITVPVDFVHKIPKFWR